MYKSFALKSLGFASTILGALMMSSAFAQVTFLGDWADFGSQFAMGGPGTGYLNGQPVSWVAGRGANHWRLVMEGGVDRLTEAQDLASPHGGAILNVKVLPGDSIGTTGERAEVADMLGSTGVPYSVTIVGAHEFYGISTKIDANWQPPLSDATHQNTWGLFMQLHSPNAFDSPPSIALAADTQFRVLTLAGDLIGADGKRRNGTYLPFTNGDLRPGHWVEFLIDVVWAYDNTGSLTVYRKDEGETTFTPVLTQIGIPTLQFDSQLPDSRNTDASTGPTFLHYWKTGYYRSTSPGVTSRLSLGPIVRGTSLQNVEAAAFGPSVIPKPPSGLNVRN